MAKARVHNLLVTLDGFSTGEGQNLNAAFGHAQEQFQHGSVLSVCGAECSPTR
jgi:hypothetical protein